jgi:hypothetical protein
VSGCDLRARLRQVVSELRKASLLSITGKRRIHHAAEKKR